MSTSGHFVVIHRRMGLLREAIRRRRWNDAELFYDQVNRAIGKLETDLKDQELLRTVMKGNGQE